MASFVSEACRISDVDRDSKSLRDEVLKLDQKLDCFMSKTRQAMAELRHNLHESKLDVHRSGRVFPRAAPGDFNKGFRNLHDSGSSKQVQKNTQCLLEQCTASSHGFKVEVELPTFNGSSLRLDFLDWIDTIEDYFEAMDPPDAMKCKLVASKLKGEARTWWKGLQNMRFSKGKNLINSWKKMKNLLLQRFLPTSRLTYFHNQLNKQENDDDGKHVNCSTKCSYQVDNNVQPAKVRVKEMIAENFMPGNCSTKFLNQLNDLKGEEEVGKPLMIENFPHTRCSMKFPLQTNNNNKEHKEVDLHNLESKVENEKKGYPSDRLGQDAVIDDKETELDKTIKETEKVSEIEISKKDIMNDAGSLQLPTQETPSDLSISKESKVKGIKLKPVCHALEVLSNPDPLQPYEPANVVGIYHYKVSQISYFKGPTIHASENFDPGGKQQTKLSMCIYITIVVYKTDGSTICVGLVASMGAFTLAFGGEGSRFYIPNANVMFHQPLGTIGRQYLRYKRLQNSSFVDLRKRQLELGGKAYAAIGQNGVVVLYDSLLSQLAMSSAQLLVTDNDVRVLDFWRLSETCTGSFMTFQGLFHESEFMNDGCRTLNFDPGGGLGITNGREYMTAQMVVRFTGSVKSVAVKIWGGGNGSSAIAFTGGTSSIIVYSQHIDYFVEVADSSYSVVTMKIATIHWSIRTRGMHWQLGSYAQVGRPLLGASCDLFRNLTSILFLWHFTVTGSVEDSPKLRFLPSCLVLLLKKLYNDIVKSPQSHVIRKLLQLLLRLPEGNKIKMEENLNGFISTGERELLPMVDYNEWKNCGVIVQGDGIACDGDYDLVKNIKIVDFSCFLVPSEYSWTASKPGMRMIRKIAKKKFIRWYLVFECLRECMVLYLNRSRVPAIASTSSMIEEQEILRRNSHEVTKRLPYPVHKILVENLVLKNKRKRLRTWGELCFTEQYPTSVLREKFQPSDILIDELEMFIFDPGGCWSGDGRNSRLLWPVYLCLKKVKQLIGEQKDIGPNLTRGRVILREGWNDENITNMEKKFTMMENVIIMCSCVNTSCKNRQSLKLFYKVVNGLDPPLDLDSACEASMWILVSSLVDELLRRRDGLM